MVENNFKKEDQEFFDYDSLWNKEIEKKDKKLIDDLPQGLPRIREGVKLKRVNHVTKHHVKYSYMRHAKDSKSEFEKV